MSAGSAEPAVGTGLMRVLVVEDERDSATLMAHLIRGFGYAVAIAHTGAEAVLAARGFRPRVVVLDLNLPDKHGYHIARAIRDEGDQRRVYFIAVTGWNQPADQRLSSAAGISHHLGKPASPEVLREILAAYASAERLIEARAE